MLTIMRNSNWEQLAYPKTKNEFPEDVERKLGKSPRSAKVEKKRKSKRVRDVVVSGNVDAER
jgi:hypothetical protein